MNQTHDHTRRNNIIATAIIFAMAVGVAIAYLSVVRPTHNDVPTAGTEQIAEKAVRKNSTSTGEDVISPEQEISNRYLAGEITYDEMHEARAELKRKRRAAELQAYLDQDLEYDSINGIEVPPEPPEALNNRTVAGLDHDGNGIRDDVDRALAKSYRDDEEVDEEMYEISVADARFTQRVITADLSNREFESLNREYLLNIYCHNGSLRAIGTETGPIWNVLSENTREVIINTPERAEAYAMAFAGTGGSTPTEEDCQAAAQE